MAAVARLPWADAAWERSVALPPDLDALCSPHERRWPDLSGKPREVLGGGLRSLNVRVGSDRVVRLALAEEHDLEKEAALLRLVSPDVRVPRLLDAAPRALLLEHVPHEDLPAAVDVAARVGRAAARIHAHRFERSGMLDGDLRVREPFPTAWDALRGWAEAAIARSAGRRLGDRAARVVAAWEAEGTALRAACASPRLVHADFKPANVKWIPGEREVLVLDWEFAWAGPPLADLGQFLRWGAPEPFVAAL